MITLATGTVAFETRRMRHEAAQRNLIASGLAWAQHAGGDSPTGKPRTLNVEKLAIPHGSLTVTVRRGDAPTEVRIQTSARKGNHTMTRDSQFILTEKR